MPHHRAGSFLVVLAMVGSARPCPAQDWFPAVHLGVAEGNSALHRMLGASVSLAATRRQELRLRLDASLGTTPSHVNSRSDSNLTTVSVDWIFHKHGVHGSGFMIGTGFSQDTFRWASHDYRSATARQGDSTTDVHLILGGGIGEHLRLESRLHFGLLGQNNGDAATTTSNFLLMLSAAWCF